jgi:thiol-disulfide isomerase/thioredoxin
MLSENYSISMKALFLLIFLLASLPANASDSANKIHLTNPPQPAPPLVFHDDRGGEHALSDYRGRYVLLNVWATWCPACTHELPSLDALQKAFDPKKLIVLPLSEDQDEAVVRAFYTSRALKNVPVALDIAGRAPQAFHLRGLPTTVILDPTGFEIARAEGNTTWTPAEISRLLEKH